MLLLAACGLAMLSPLLAGRWPAGLLLHRWRMPWLVWATLALQFVVLEVPMPDAVPPVLHVGTYVVALGFVWVNRRLPGLLLIGAGAFANGLTIALNGGVLPADPRAVARAGLEHDDSFANSTVVADPVLPWLGDAFAWPAPLPLANTFSVGDVLILAGVAVAAWSGARRFGAAERVDAPADADGHPADR
ncbi:DUF5317 domain-containing protein [Actinotalea sp. AC32]|nr:DUF5317 domain-containing protein [Actinotalea sp. AC32]